MPWYGYSLGPVAGRIPGRGRVGGMLRPALKSPRCRGIPRAVKDMNKRALFLVLMVLALPGSPARAVDVAPFDPVLERLAEILGSLHYLRGVCGSNEGNKWRNEMQALIDAETPSGQRRSQ